VVASVEVMKSWHICPEVMAEEWEEPIKWYSVVFDGEY